MQLWCGGMFNNHTTVTCSQEFAGENILKIGQYLAKI